MGSYRSPPQAVRRGRFGISRGEGEAGETTTTNGTSAKAEYQSTFYTTVASRALRVSKEPGGTPHPAQGQKPFFPGRRGLVVRLDSLLTAPRQGRAGFGLAGMQTASSIVYCGALIAVAAGPARRSASVGSSGSAGRGPAET